VADRPLIDRWMVSRLTALENVVDHALETYDATTAARALIEFVDDDLANWYVRLNRSRFYDVDSADNRAAFATLYDVLVSVCRLLAPLAPFVSDWIHRELTGTSVHLAPFVSERDYAGDPSLDAAMDAVRTLARLGRAVREEIGIKVRQPLSRMICVAPRVSEAALEPLIPLLAAELNVKRVEFASSGDALVTLEAKPNFRALGKKFGKATPLAAAAAAAFTSEDLRGFLHGAALVVTVEGTSHELGPDDLTIVRRSSGSLAVQEDAGFFVALDPEVSPELKLEGYARELISRVQRMRKESGFAVSDRIVLQVAGPQEVQDVGRAHGAWIAEEVLAAELELVSDAEQGRGSDMHAIDLDGLTAFVAITRIE
jgi:isoleucyl-tRNA synthetase